MAASIAKEIAVRVLFVGMALIASMASAEGKQSKVQVDGSTYRVVVKDDAVTVFKKSFMVKYGVAERDAQRRAVQLATGCSVVDELPTQNGRLTGKLNCGGSPAKQ